MGALLVALSVTGCEPKPRTFDEDRAFQHLLAQVAYGPRVPGTDGHARTLEYMVEHLEGRADRVVLHEFTEHSPLDSTRLSLTNVRAEFNAAASSRILFGAHWDTRPISDKEEVDDLRATPGPGANDGASGVAVLLEVATALAERAPGVGVDLLFFDLEDSGQETLPETWALGSQRFVADHPEYRPSFVVIVDMVGKRGLEIPKEANSLAAAPLLVQRVWAVGRKIGCTVLSDSVGPPIMDDHIPFLAAGIPALDLIDWEDPSWHTTRDTPENCAPESLGEIGRLLLALVEVAEEAVSP